MIQAIKDFLQEVREGWEVNILGKRLRDKKGRYAKGRKIKWK